MRWRNASQKGDLDRIWEAKLAAYYSRAVAALGATLILLSSAGASRAGDETGAAQCAAQGKAAFYSESTDTCIKFGTYLWGEGYYNTYAKYPAQNDRKYGIGTLGVKMNTVTDAEYGPIRTFVNLRFQYRSANEWSNGPDKFAFVPWDAFIDYAGFTFGHQGSKFDFYANANIMGTDPATIGDFEQLLLAAYTHRFAHGWSATLSIEEPWARMGGVNAANASSKGIFRQNTSVPDFVGAIAQKGAWGEFQFSAALHHVKAKTFSTPAQGYQGAQNPGMWGYALQAGIVFDLPQIAPGDSLFLQTAYVNGATTYLGLVNASGNFSQPDAYITGTGKLSGVTGWNMTTQFLHNWTSKLQSAFFGGYARFYLNNAEAKATYGASGGVNYNLGANLTWTPVAPFSLVLQYDYNMYQAANFVPTGNGMPRRSQNAHQVLLMAQYRL